MAMGKSNICVKVGNMYRTIYCHRDGYISCNGAILLKHYNSQELAEDLVSHGDIDSLGKKCSEYDRYSYGDYTVYFGRDLGNEDSDYRESEKLPFFREEYLYIFENGKWYVVCDYIPEGYQELTEELIALDYQE
ncbi:hypothetical protein [uncultured Gilliamella sp.]|uniref:hypothetical protein n=1 Tax=uncultured Gilliamella sp. TaxID=1193505 RepID=UPI0025F7DB57|nr:hypothetical protein [uncultured Gilliamella sp.]